MEPKFQTSFIPKNPIVSTTNNVGSSVVYGSTNIFSVIATAFFLVTAIISGGLFGYKVILKKQIDQSIEEINVAKGALEIDKIESLVDTNSQIVSSKNLLDKHVSVSKIIDLVQHLTVKRISLVELKFTEDSGVWYLNTDGQSQSYNALAEQGSIFRKNEYIKNPKFSGFNPGVNGNINFKFSASISSDLILYKKSIDSEDLAQPPTE